LTKDNCSHCGTAFEYGAGDIQYQHRLMVGDATSAEDVALLMDGEDVHLLFTSPPYLAQRTYEIGGFDWDALMNGMSNAGFPHLRADGSALINIGLVHRSGRVVRYWEKWIAHVEDAGWPFYGWYVWDQGWGLPGDWGGRLAPSFEFLFHFARSPRHTDKTVPTKTMGKVRNSTFRSRDGSLHPFTGNGEVTGHIKVADSVVRVTRQIGRVSPGEDHPAVFSVAFPESLIPIWTEKGEIVYEPFSGSGTTIIACEKLDRRCYAMEIEPRYVDVAIRRWEAFTGKQAVVIE
jgi:DNA modification methylase